MWTPFAFWPSFVATLIAVALVFLVVLANIRKPGNLAAFLMFLGMLIWSFGEMIERVAGPPPANPNLHLKPMLGFTAGSHDVVLAYLGAIILCFGIYLLVPALIHFAFDYPYKLKVKESIRKYVLYILYGISFVAMAINIVNQFVGYLTIKYVYPYKAVLYVATYPVYNFNEYIWGLKAGPVHFVMNSLLAIFAIIFVIVVLLKLRGVKINIIKKQIIITVIGFLIMFITLILTTYIPMFLTSEDNAYPLTTLSFTIFGAFIMYTIARYRMFLVVPKTEEAEEEEELPEEGIYWMKQEEAYHKFSMLARSGFNAIGFIVPPIEEFKSKYKLVHTPLFQITKKIGKDKLNPEISEHREMISFIIMSMLEEVYKPVILIDLTAQWISDKTKNEMIETIKGISKEIGGVYLIAGVEPEEKKD